MKNESLLDALADPSRYTEVHPGDYTIGIDAGAAQRIAAGSGGRINPDWILTACPRHSVRLNGCLVADFLVTRELFALFADATGYRTEAERDGWGWVFRHGWQKRSDVSWRFPFLDAGDDSYNAHPDCAPVMQATWNDAQALCRWLSDVLGQTYRLPTEGEWEAGAGLRGAMSAVDASTAPMVPIPRDSREYVRHLISTCLDSGGALPTGRMWEWCADWFLGYPGGSTHREFGSTYKVLRGGSLLSHPLQRVREYRFRRCPTARSPYYGIRIAMEAS